MKTRCIIVDDEPIARGIIRKHLENIPNVEIAGECKNAMEAMVLLKQNKIDLMFLDIQMPKLTGIEFLGSLSHPPKVIIVTAYRDFAPEGFEYDVIDYLLKPVPFDRFLKAMNKYFDSRDNSPVILDEKGNALSGDLFMYAKENKKVRKIYLKDIIFIESLKEYVRIHTAGKRVVSKLQISALEKQLPDSHFLRIHKSYIINTSYITAFTSHSIELGDHELTISRTYKDSVLKALKYHDGAI
jgi:DNA-binding LytR/AlgR family response regulator